MTTWTYIFVLLLSAFAHAKVFSNSYVQFEMPDRWECKLEGTEWVCRSIQKDQAKQAIIVLTAKEVGPTDTLDAYEAHLKKAKTVPSTKGKPSVSQLKSLQRRQINGHTWVDSMHLGSELPLYYTRYLASVKDRLAILVTFSAHQAHFTKYSSDFFKAVSSLRVTAKFNLDRSPTTGAPAPGGEVIGQGVAVPVGDPVVEEYPPEAGSSGSSGKTKVFALAILLAAIGAYIYLKKRKK